MSPDALEEWQDRVTDLQVNESTEAKDAAAEIRSLAEECLEMLPLNAARPGEPSEPT